jgi:hypothetical protein
VRAAGSTLARPKQTDAEASYRPQAARQVFPKLPDAQPGFFAFRFYEAAARDLRQPAKFGRTNAHEATFEMTGHKVEQTSPNARTNSSND